MMDFYLTLACRDSGSISPKISVKIHLLPAWGLLVKIIIDIMYGVHWKYCPAEKVDWHASITAAVRAKAARQCVTLIVMLYVGWSRQNQLIVQQRKSLIEPKNILVVESFDCQI